MYRYQILGDPQPIFDTKLIKTVESVYRKKFKLNHVYFSFNTDRF